MWTFYASIYLKPSHYELLFSVVHKSLLSLIFLSLSGALYQLSELQFYWDNGFKIMLSRLLFPTYFQGPIRYTQSFSVVVSPNYHLFCLFDPLYTGSYIYWLPGFMASYLHQYELIMGIYNYWWLITSFKPVQERKKYARFAYLAS